MDGRYGRQSLAVNVQPGTGLMGEASVDDD